MPNQDPNTPNPLDALVSAPATGQLPADPSVTVPASPTAQPLPETPAISTLPADSLTQDNYPAPSPLQTSTNTPTTLTEYPLPEPDTSTTNPGYTAPIAPQTNPLPTLDMSPELTQTQTSLDPAMVATMSKADLEAKAEELINNGKPPSRFSQANKMIMAMGGGLAILVVVAGALAFNLGIVGEGTREPASANTNCHIVNTDQGDGCWCSEGWQWHCDSAQCRPDEVSACDALNTGGSGGFPNCDASQTACQGNEIPGSSRCFQNGNNLVWCCPAGSSVVNGQCSSGGGGGGGGATPTPGGSCDPNAAPWTSTGKQVGESCCGGGVSECQSGHCSASGNNIGICVAENGSCGNGQVYCGGCVDSCVNTNGRTCQEYILDVCDELTIQGCMYGCANNGCVSNGQPVACCGTGCNQGSAQSTCGCTSEDCVCSDAVGNACIPTTSTLYKCSSQTWCQNGCPSPDCPLASSHPGESEFDEDWCGMQQIDNGCGFRSMLQTCSTPTLTPVPTQPGYTPPPAATATPVPQLVCDDTCTVLNSPCSDGSVCQQIGSERKCRDEVYPDETDCEGPPPQQYACIDLEYTRLSGSGEPNKLGQQVTFTCEAGPSASAYYQFRYRHRTSNTATWSAYSSIEAASAGSDTSAPFTFTNPGEYQVQCKACQDSAGNVCTAWETL